MIFRTFINIFRGAYLPKTLLGRWNIHNHRETMIKVRYANEDNCGVSYIKKTPEPDDNNDNNDEYIYMMGYESTHQ